MTRRQMGEGSLLRVMFGRQPHSSPMRRNGCLTCLVILAVVTTALTVASHNAMGYL